MLPVRTAWFAGRPSAQPSEEDGSERFTSLAQGGAAQTPDSTSHPAGSLRDGGKPPRLRKQNGKWSALGSAASTLAKSAVEEAAFANQRAKDCARERGTTERPTVIKHVKVSPD